MQKTIGTVAVIALAATAGWRFLRRRSRRPAGEPNRRPVRVIARTDRPPSGIQSPHFALDVAGFPQALAKRGCELRPLRGRGLPKKPITGIAGCCARTASGHAAEKANDLTSSHIRPKLKGGIVPAQTRTLIGLKLGVKTVAACTANVADGSCMDGARGEEESDYQRSVRCGHVFGLLMRPFGRWP